MNKAMTKAQVIAENEMLRSQNDRLSTENSDILARFEERGRAIHALSVKIQAHEGLIRILTDRNDGLVQALDYAQTENEELVQRHRHQRVVVDNKDLLAAAKSYAMTHHVLTRVHNGTVQSFNNGSWRNV
jgi:hypothetical protein